MSNAQIGSGAAQAAGQNAMQMGAQNAAAYGQQGSALAKFTGIRAQTSKISGTTWAQWARAQ
jgi:hypothetical protein